MTVHTEKIERIEGSQRRIKVWDRLVRIFHWSVAIAFFVAYFSEDELLTIHVWAGYTIGALIVLRIVWGFVGPRHARFSDFVTGPWTALRYLLDLFAFRAKRYLGHSPAGGVMVLLFLTGLLATVWSGMELHAVENNAGPLAATTITSDIDAARAWPPSIAFVPVAHADEGERMEKAYGALFGEDAWEEIHEALANLVLILVILHVLGIVLASVVHRENLVISMLTGWKRAE